MTVTGHKSANNSTTTAEGASRSRPLTTPWVLSGTLQIQAYVPEDAGIAAAFNYVLNALKNKGKSFVDDFAATYGEEEDHDGKDLHELVEDQEKIDLDNAFKCLSTGRTILHQIIQSVSENNLDPNDASDLTRAIVKEERSLIKERISGHGRSNALELAASSQNCLEIIKAICESGMVSEKNEKEVDPGEAESRPINVPAQQLKASAEAHLQPSVSLDVPVVSGHFSTNSTTSVGEVQKPRRIKKDGKIITIRVAWEDLTEDGADTCLHTAIKSENNEYASYLLRRMHYTEEHKLILRHRGQSGLTPLHLAVDSKQCSTERVDLVKSIMDLYPDALSMKSRANDDGVRKENLAPYKYFVESKATVTHDGNNRSIAGLTNVRDKKPGKRQQRQQGRIQPNAQPSKEVNDQSAVEAMDQLLRLGCMRYHGKSRESITDLLGRPNQIHLDLNPREEVTQQFFDYMETIRFEPYLLYVYIPNLRVLDDVKFKDSKPDRQPWWRSKSRKDYFYIFSWLRTSRSVKRILSIVVEDDPSDFHGDEVIEEAVKDFDIEEWDWVKPDMCSETILAAAKNVRDLTLHWSGNRAVLRSWALPGGLANLGKLEKITIKTQETIESSTRFAKLEREFRDDLGLSWEKKKWGRAMPKADFDIVPAQQQTVTKLSEKEREENSLQQQWFTCMDEFGRTLLAYLNNRDGEDGRRRELDENEVVKVAIIDDGVYPDRDGIGGHIDAGETFYDIEGHWPGHYQSTYGHGHLMACLIKRLCPRVRFYIAKLNELWRHGRSQITTESAAEAIRWATDKGVDVISMSWTIETPQEDAKSKLTSAVEEALRKDILLFCASDDQGNLNSIPYPARIDPRIFWIGSATALGTANDETQKTVTFIAPGTEEVQEQRRGQRLSFAKPRVGSSIATARCAGLAALILQCILLSPEAYQRDQVRKEGNMRKMFKRMTGDQSGHCKYLRVWDVFTEAKMNAGIEDEFEIIRYAASTFLKDVAPVSTRSSSQLRALRQLGGSSTGLSDLQHDLAASDTSTLEDDHAPGH
ncbi:MAG: hypothetical protein M1822_009678 [Bathelium mastoideum]|nr:MAG: hypothetical protein M1822_009678 [Bathelium mastoideum]